MRISAILLAAGESKRFGSHKLSYVYKGKPLVQHALDTLSSVSAITEIKVVVNNTKPYALSPEPYALIVNSDYKQGMGTSLREGVRACSDNTDAYLIALADMPHVQKETVEALITEYHKGNCEILIPKYKEQKGHPIIMSARFKEELLSLNQDKGARDVIGAHEESVGFVDVEDGGVLFDVDVREDVT
ncbi:MAG: nucleotidyltransferase family protein [bacterium]|nr:nucleotidyltransferase family protein [bacterium]MBU1918810.1 nucleotidyltransferase family protein [bacterium]